MISSEELYQLEKMLGDTVVPGFDDQQGNQLPLSTLSPYWILSTNPYSSIYYDKALDEIIIKQNGAVLKGYNFSGVHLEVDANNVTITNCTFDDKAGWFTIVQNAGYSGMTVTNCTFNGGDNINLASFVMSYTGYTTVSDNRFIDTPSHAVQISDGVVSNNYFSGSGYLAGAHADAISVLNTTGPVLITGNFIDWTNNPDALTGTNNGIRITTEVGNTSNVTVTNNIVLGGHYGIYVYYGPMINGSFSNVNVYDNYIGDYVDAAYYVKSAPGVTLGSYTNIGFDNPALSAAAWSAYQASSIVTDTLVMATPGGPNISAAALGTTTLYGDGQTIHLYGGKSETIFVGGAGTQYMWGGAGKNIYSYLAFSDSTVAACDLIGNFNVATNVIDLHALNANPASSTPVNFNFIGDAAFSSAGGEVRVVQDVAHNLTLVEATVAGDSTADLEIRLNGLLNLTAANFALTTAQYDADIAAYTTVASFLGSEASLGQIPVGYSIVDSLANIQPNLVALEADARNINAVTATDGVISVNVATFLADQTILNKFVGGFAIVDTGAHIQAQIGALENDVGPIATVTISDSTAASPDVLSLSVVSAASDAAILAKIAAPYVLNVVGASGTTVTGHGSGLTIDIAAGDATVTGGTKGDTFYLAAQFGATQITDFGQYETNATPDTISLSTTDFANWATLLADGHQSGANTVFTAADGASLTLDNVSLSGLQHASAALQAEFKFHA